MRAALIVALAGAAWAIYRQLPNSDGPAVLRGAEQPPETMVQIVLRRVAENKIQQPNTEVPVKFYSVDVAAVQREFLSERRAGMRFEDFIEQRMGDRLPITAQLNGEGQTIIGVPPGKWWIYATLSGTFEDVSWRLPVNVSGHKQTIILTPKNAYTRTKSF